MIKDGSEKPAVAAIPADTSHLHTGKGCCIDADRTRRHLRNSEHINELGHRQPVMSINNTCLDERHGSISAADTEDADLDEFPKQLKIYHDGTSLIIFRIPEEQETDNAINKYQVHYIHIIEE